MEWEGAKVERWGGAGVRAAAAAEGEEGGRERAGEGVRGHEREAAEDQKVGEDVGEREVAQLGQHRERREDGQQQRDQHVVGRQAGAEARGRVAHLQGEGGAHHREEEGGGTPPNTT